MQIVNNGSLKILLPDKGCKLVNKNTGKEYTKVYLGKFDTIENYTEILDKEYTDALSEIQQNHDSEMVLLMETINSLIMLLEPVIASIPFSLEEDSNNSIDKIIMFYAEMIKKNLKTIEEVPNVFRDQVINIINK